MWYDIKRDYSEFIPLDNSTSWKFSKRIELKELNFLINKYKAYKVELIKKKSTGR